MMQAEFMVLASKPGNLMAYQGHRSCGHANNRQATNAATHPQGNYSGELACNWVSLLAILRNRHVVCGYSCTHATRVTDTANTCSTHGVLGTRFSPASKSGHDVVRVVFDR